MKKYVSIMFFSILIISACGEKKIENASLSPVIQISNQKLQKVTFFLENSESMFGYVNGLTEYVQVISELSSKSDFSSNQVSKEFVLINGKKPLSINSLGDISSSLNSVLTPGGFNRGNTGSSELNEMLKLAMQSAGNGKISVFISDGIFDINNKANIAKYLTLESGVTKANFISKLSKASGFETLLIKLNSDFKGKYFYATLNKSQNIDQKRPYYIWVFGDSQLVNQYFDETFINNNLKVPSNYFRFIKLGKPKIQYGIAKGINRRGNFDVVKNNLNSIDDAEKDNTGNFSFSFAVDFNGLPFSESDLTSKAHYTLSSNYEIGMIQRIEPSHIAFLPVINNFHATHIITLVCKSKKTHIGAINIQLKNVLPTWIDSVLKVEQVKSPLTYGFDKLTSGIADAYNVYNFNKNLAEFMFQVKP